MATLTEREYRPMHLLNSPVSRYIHYTFEVHDRKQG